MNFQTDKKLYDECLEALKANPKDKKKILKEYSELFAPIAKALYCKENLSIFLHRVRRKKWITLEDIYFITPHGLGCVNPTFPTDLCSRSPEADWWYACVVHDWGYKTQKYCRIKYDRILMYLIHTVSDRWYAQYAAVIYFHAVHLFGWVAWLRKKDIDF